MFRKPKAKGAIRQRKNEDLDDNESTENESKEVAKISTKPPGIMENDADSKSQTQTKFSFDMDEGADSTFEVKKNKKKVDELKRMQKLEEESEKFTAERKKEEAERKQALESVVKKEKEKKLKDNKNNRNKYLDKYRDSSAKHISSGYDEDLDIDEDSLGTTDVTKKFSSLGGGIPDSRAVYEAKKRRERLRREGQDGYIPLDDTQKLRSKAERGRLIREDENDDSDEEEPNRFYSARELLRTEEDRRKQEQNEFLNRENAEDQEDEGIEYYGSSNRKKEEDFEMEEWEKQQILKAVSGRAIGQLRNEKRNTAMLLGGNVAQEDISMEDMDIDMDIDMDGVVGKPSFNGPANTGGVVMIEDILAKLKLRINERDLNLNTRREKELKMRQNLDENNQMINKIEMELPHLSTKFTMYQELRVYCRSLLECLNEKVSEINEIGDKKRQCAKMRTTRLIKRRRQDVRDQYSECSTSAAGKNVNTVKVGEAAVRSAEREARRGRRRRERESTLSGISHEEGLSTDDEETTSQTIADKKINDEVDAVASVIFADALEEYADLRRVLGRMTDWLAVDTKSFQDAYVYLCLPKLCSPYIRLQMITSDVLNNDVFITQMNWYKDVMLAGVDNTELDQEHEILVGLVPAIIEKVVTPFLIDVVKDEWDPLSLKQTRHLVQFCEIFSNLPTLSENSKPFVAFLDAIREKLVSSIDEDLFVPMFVPSALENASTGCKSYHDRQYWTSIKLIKSINTLSPIISMAARFELVVDKIVNGTCVVALRTGSKTDASVERKLRTLFDQLDEKLLRMGGMTSFRQLIATLNGIADAQEQAGKSFYKEIRKFVSKVER